jgi:hypothetical protein
MQNILDIYVAVHYLIRRAINCVAPRRDTPLVLDAKRVNPPGISAGA